MIWPSTGRAWALLEGVKVQLDNAVVPENKADDRRKRQADDAFGQEKNSDYLSREAFGPVEVSPSALPGSPGIQDINTRIMAHMLGLDVPGIEPSTSYYPGYEWWPRTDGSSPPQPTPPSPFPTPCAAPATFDSPASLEEWLRTASMSTKTGPNYGFDFSAATTPTGQ